MRKDPFNKDDMIAWALGEVLGQASYVDVQDVAVYLHGANPKAFGLSRYRQHPDVDAVRTRLSHMQKPLPGHVEARVEQLSPEPGKKRQKSACYRLTGYGSVWYQGNKEAVSSFVGVSSKMGATRNAEKISMLAAARIEARRSFHSGTQTIMDFLSVFMVSPASSQAEYLKSRDKTFAALSYKTSTARHLDFARRLDKMFGSDFKEEFVKHGKRS